MITEKETSTTFACKSCIDGTGLDFEFTMAFQPIVDVKNKAIFAHEALVRGLENQPAASILSQVNDHNRYRFDQNCRVKAINLAAQLNLDTYLSVNFMPNAVYRPENCIRTTLQTAAECNFPHDKIIFEVNEGEKIEDKNHLLNIFNEYKRLGFKTAIDDFGAGHSGLNLLAKLRPDIIKLDMELIRDIDKNEFQQAIVTGIISFCQNINCTIIAEGVETKEEAVTLYELGVNLLQGYYFAKPLFKNLAKVDDGAFSTLSS